MNRTKTEQIINLLSELIVDSSCARGSESEHPVLDPDRSDTFLEARKIEMIALRRIRTELEDMVGSLY